MTNIFNALGNGDTMMGIRYVMYGVLAMILILIIWASTIIAINSKSKKAMENVKLTSVKTTQIKEKRKKGSFNFELMNNEQKEQPIANPSMAEDSVHKDKSIPAPTPVVSLRKTTMHPMMNPKKEGSSSQKPHARHKRNPFDDKIDINGLEDR